MNKLLSFADETAALAATEAPKRRRGRPRVKPVSPAPPTHAQRWEAHREQVAREPETPRTRTALENIDARGRLKRGRKPSAEPKKGLKVHVPVSLMKAINAEAVRTFGGVRNKLVEAALREYMDRLSGADADDVEELENSRPAAAAVVFNDK